MAAGVHVSISAEPILNLGSFSVTNSMFTGTIVSLLLIAFVLIYSTTKLKIKGVSRLQSLLELVVEAIFNMCRDIVGEKKARIFFPLIATFLLFILFNNWIGLFPGVGTIGVKQPVSIGETAIISEVEHSSETTELQEETADIAKPELMATEGEVIETEAEEHKPIPLFRAATADLNTTLALALISVIYTQVVGVQYLGLKYFTKFFNFTQGPIFTFVGLLELISEFAKIVSFAFRLFGNIFAGEVLLVVIAFLSEMIKLPIIKMPFFPFLSLPFLGLEVFVGLIQALVFAMLSLVFINMATVSHDEH